MPNSAALPSPPRDRSKQALALAGLAATLASGCCVVPLVLALMGVSGAWIGRLRLLAPYSTVLNVLAVVLLAGAGWKIFSRPNAACTAPDARCATTQDTARRWFWLVIVLTLVPLVTPLLAPLFY